MGLYFTLHLLLKSGLMLVLQYCTKAKLFVRKVMTDFTTEKVKHLKVYVNPDKDLKIKLR